MAAPAILNKNGIVKKFISKKICHTKNMPGSISKMKLHVANKHYILNN